MLATCLNAACLALLDAGIQCNSMLSVRSAAAVAILQARWAHSWLLPQAICIATTGDGARYLMDPTLYEEKVGACWLTNVCIADSFGVRAALLALMADGRERGDGCVHEHVGRRCCVGDPRRAER